VKNDIVSGAPWFRRATNLIVTGVAAVAVVGFGLAAAMPAGAASMVLVDGVGETNQAAIESGYDKCAGMGHTRGGTTLEIGTYTDIFGSFVMARVACVGPDGQIVYQ